MSIFEAIGMAWVIFTSTLASVEIIYLAIVGLRSMLNRYGDMRERQAPIEVNEMFKVAR